MKDWLKRPLTRRQFLGKGGAAALCMGAGMGLGVGWSANLVQSAQFDALTVTDYRLLATQWPKHYPSLTIAFLTDLHVGSAGVNLEKLDGIVAQVNALKADIILLGGDFLTANSPQRWLQYFKPEPIAAKLAPLAAPLGVYGVLGNHDWYCDGEGMRSALEHIGVTVMENAAHFIPFGPDGFWLAGLADFLTRKPDYAGTMAQAKGGQPKIVLSHDPITYRALTDEAMLQLSGHTHGGQVRLPLIGPVVSPTPGMPLKWLYGLVEDGPAPMIVSSGVGTSVLPLKNTPCEVVRVTVAAKDRDRDGQIDWSYYKRLDGRMTGDALPLALQGGTG